MIVVEQFCINQRCPFSVKRHCTKTDVGYKNCRVKEVSVANEDNPKGVNKQ
jgi:hypothetical protein